MEEHGARRTSQYHVRWGIHSPASAPLLWWRVTGGGADVEQRKQPTRPPSDNVNHEATRGKNWRVRGHPIPEDPHESDTYMSRYRAGQARTALGHRAPRAEREARSGPCASVSGPGPAPSSAPSSAPSTMVRNSRIETPRRRGPGGAGGRKPARRPQTGGQDHFTLAGQGIGRLSPLSPLPSPLPAGEGPGVRG